jgi:deferrochelatase/peroxidase EfeB
VSTTPIAPQLNRADIQGNLLRGYRAADARHFALGIGQARGAAAFINGLVSGDEQRSPQISTDEHWDERPEYWLNIGLTWAGLKKLGVPDGVLGDFPQAFQQGPAVRAGLDPDFAETVGLGDIGNSDPEHWILGGTGTETAHILLSLYTDEHRIRNLDAVSVRLRDRFAATGLHEIWTEDAKALPHGGVHFHYVDGIAQPEIEGSTPRDRPDLQPKAPPGDFLLGRDYVNAFGGNYLGNLLQALGDNGTYGAFRVLRQDVAGFEQLLTRWAQETGLDRELLAAKLLGRWRHRGVPLALSPYSDQAYPPVDTDHLNAFDYVAVDGHPTVHDDPVGLRCPIGAHIRRLNPRGSLVTGLPHSRRLIRRGMAYGPPFDPRHPDKEERGLMGLFICGDLELQYEFILRVWANQDLATHGLRGTRDPIIGHQPDAGGEFVLRTDNSRDPLVLTGLPTLVQTMGSLYCFIPGIGGLRYLASLPVGQAT